MEIAGNIVIAAGMLFVFFGVFGIFKYSNFYTRILAGAKIDTVGAVTVFIGIMLRHGFSFFSLKVLVMMVIILIINPLASHMIVRSAWLSGFKPENSSAGTKEYNEDHL